MNPDLRAPFPWFGGKSRAAGLIWERLGDVPNYVEPFAGSMAVLLKRPHSPRVETVNDRDCYLANFWRAVKQDPDQVARHAYWPVNECDLHARHKWLCEQSGFRERMLSDPDYYEPKIAGWWVWGISQWIGGGWCSRPEWMGRGQGGRARRGINTVDGIYSQPDGKYKRPVINRGGRGVYRSLPNKTPRMSGSGTGVHRDHPLFAWMHDLSDRLQRVRVICGDWARVVTPSCTWKVGGTMLTGVLLDPPYSHDLRDSCLYPVDQDVSTDVRTWAIEVGQNPLMRIALSGLDGEHEMPHDWEPVSWNAPRGYSNGPRREVVWFSPHCIKQRRLFDDAAVCSIAYSATGGVS